MSLSPMRYPGWVHALSSALVYRAGLTLLIGWWITVTPPRHPTEGDGLLHDLPRVDSLMGKLCVVWDSYWYLNIIKHGYHEVPGVESNTAFLPAYPWIVKFVSQLGVGAPVAGVAVSIVFMISALSFAYLYGRDRYGPECAWGLVLFLAVFPSSWVFHMVYTESLFCTALFGFLWLYHTRRFAWAGAVGVLLPLTRGVGLAILPAILADVAIEAWRTRKLPRNMLIALAGPLLGLILIATFYHQISGHPLAFLETTQRWSTQVGATGHLAPLVHVLSKNLGDPEAQLYLPFLALYAVLIVALLVQRRDVSSFFAVFYFMMMMGVSHASAMRYLLPLLPIHAWIVFGLMRRGGWVPVMAVSAVVQVILTRLYLNWEFVV